MDDATAISASLVDARNIGTHKSLKLTLHIPAEQAEAFIRDFGWPTAAEPIPVALARLIDNAAAYVP